MRNAHDERQLKTQIEILQSNQFHWRLEKFPMSDFRNFGYFSIEAFPKGKSRNIVSKHRYGAQV